MRVIETWSTAVLVLVLAVAADPLCAGPLDRGPMAPRVNPATNDMLRVPGVVGMDRQGALATLEQAGLNPRIHELRKVTKRYAGREGTVVRQLPLPGGMAMLGSSVSITVYDPGGSEGGVGAGGPPAQPPSYPDNGGPGYDGSDYGGYDTGGAPPDPDPYGGAPPVS